jgi:cytoskeleton protein RodZ
MIETAAPDSAGLAVPAQEADEALTAGAMLRRSREAAGLHVAALAVSLKVPVRKLEALENDQYEQLPDAVFVRALASSVCRTLKIDPQPVLERLPQSAAPRLIQDTDGLNAPFRGPRDGVAPTWPEQLSKPVTLAVGGLLLAALGLIFLPRTQTQEPVAQEAKTIEVPSPDAPAANEQAAPVPPTATVGAAGATVQTDNLPAASLPAPSAAAPVAVPPAVTAAAGAAPSAPASAPAAAASGIVMFHTTQQSWVEVTDAKGVVAFRKLMGAGEDGAASGALPLQVTVGRADATSVQVRGKAFDLRPLSRDNVARFEVK